MVYTRFSYKPQTAANDLRKRPLEVQGNSSLGLRPKSKSLVALNTLSLRIAIYSAL